MSKVCTLFLIFFFFLSLPLRGWGEDEDEDLAPPKTELPAIVHALTPDKNVPAESETVSQDNEEEGGEVQSSNGTHLRAPYDKKKLLENLAIFHTMPEKEIKSVLLTNLKDSPAGEIFKRNPRILSFVAKLLKDKKAIPSLLMIKYQKTKLYQYITAFFILLIFGFLWKHLGGGKHGFILSFFRGIFISLVITVLQFGAGLYIFWQELGPTVQIFKSVFL